jgi:outer membrane lipoprotein SlyB
MISAQSNKLKAGIEYGSVMGVGAITGAYLGGPVGALAGTIVGAGVVTTHLLVSHPQAHLDNGDVLMLTVTEQIHMDPVTNSTGN